MVAGRSVSFPAQLCIVLVVGLYCGSSCNANAMAPNIDHCEASSCGNIRNISYPFRLKHDPLNCGDPRYELSCENNRTLLYLFSGIFYVQSINYDNRTIRVVDANLQKGNFSSIPRYSLSNYNFSFGDDDPYRISQWRKYHNGTFDYFELSKPVIFITCTETPLNSPLYVHAAPYCINDAMSKGHVFVKIGHLNASELKDSCRIELMVLITSRPRTKNMNLSYIDIHNELLYGFELSWLQSYGIRNQRWFFHYIECYIDDETNKAICGISYYWNSLTMIQYFCLKYLNQLCQLSVFCFALPVYLTTACLTVWFATKTVLGIPCIIVLLIYKLKRRHLSMYGHIEEFLQSHNNLMPIRYSYSHIKKMTDGFKDKLGEGGYGFVYRGKLRSGRLVAIKMLGKSKANGQDFINEVATIGRIHHVNVVQLIGYCAEGSKRALVYEFMPNGSLDKSLFSKEGPTSLSCKKSFEISIGVACGIDYLHKGCDMQILHFDIKPHNILLDENFVPKISDFGLARLCPLDDSSLTLTAARGTIGYIAPELFYKNIGGVSYKADIYSFGMLLMEIAGKRKNLNAVAAHSSQIYFPMWVYDQFSEGNDIEMEDATEEENKMTKKMLIVALWCIQMKPSDRPNSMHKVVEMLEGEIECLHMPPKLFLYPQDNPVVVYEDNSKTTWSSTPSNDDVEESISLIENADEEICTTI